MKGYMYILRCSDNSYYIGSTNNLTLRLEEHSMGLGAEYTKHRLPIKIVYIESFDSIQKAYEREKQIQGWSRSKREALISKNFELLSDLSKNKTNKKLKSSLIKTVDIDDFSEINNALAGFDKLNQRGKK